MPRCALHKIERGTCERFCSSCKKFSVCLEEAYVGSGMSRGKDKSFFSFVVKFFGLGNQPKSGEIIR